MVIFILSVCILHLFFGCWGYRAVTCVPVADLVGEAQGSIHTYAHLPLCSSTKGGCLRLHQLLLHEPVTILEEKNDEVKIEIHNLFYQTATSSEPHALYWSLKKNFIPLSKLSAQEQALLPPTLSWKNPSFSGSYITLLYPHVDTPTGYTFSAGTRFMLQEKKGTMYRVACLHPSKKKIVPVHLPAHLCIKNNPSASSTQKRETFLTILKRWAHLPEGFIPYVWGGCSFTHACTHPEFTHHNGIYTRLHTVHPKTGFDCTGLIARAAQMADIPYYYKNSTTLEKQLAPISGLDEIANGDIIWFSGHALVLSDIKKGLIIEARAYDHGFGKIHEAPLSTIFKNIFTVQDLFAACQKKIPLQRLDSRGNAVQTIARFKIVKLPA